MRSQLVQRADSNAVDRLDDRADREKRIAEAVVLDGHHHHAAKVPHPGSSARAAWRSPATEPLVPEALGDPVAVDRLHLVEHDLELESPRMSSSSLQTSSTTRSPRREEIIDWSCSSPRTRRPSTNSTMSPSSIPARSAGEPSITRLMATPSPS